MYWPAFIAVWGYVWLCVTHRLQVGHACPFALKNSGNLFKNYFKQTECFIMQSLLSSLLWCLCVGVCERGGGYTLGILKSPLTILHLPPSSSSFSIFKISLTSPCPEFKTNSSADCRPDLNNNENYILFCL